MERVDTIHGKGRICHQKIVLSIKTKIRLPSQELSRDKKSDVRQSSHHTYDGSHKSTCFICGATDHVATSGPAGMKLIQYFA